MQEANPAATVHRYRPKWIRPLASRPDGALVCENVVVLGAGGQALTWPHWVLKHLYGPIGLMFGKFSSGEQRPDCRGRNIPPPPVSFLPVRVAVKPRDPRFLRQTPGLASAVAEAIDDGRDVFTDRACDWKEIKQWARNLLPQQ